MMRQVLEIMSCYARRDQYLLQELKKHLSPLSREGLITLWDDMELKPGEKWEEEIKKHLAAAHIILLLVSADLIASEYFYSKEMKQAMERHQRGEVCVIPIILRPVDWNTSPFAVLQALPPGAQPITTYANQDSAFITIATEIRKLVKGLVEKEEQERVELLEKKVRRACRENDKLALADAYDELQDSPYAHLVNFTPQLQQQIDQAYQEVQELRTLLATIRATLARKRIGEIAKISRDMEYSRHDSSFIKSFLTEEERKIIQAAGHWDYGDAYPKLYEKYREAFDFTPRELSQIKQAKRDTMSLVQSTIHSYLNREASLKRRSNAIIAEQINEGLDYNRKQRSITIAIFGDTVSGQHTYFTALIHELERWMKNNEKDIQARCVIRGDWDRSIDYLFRCQGVLPFLRENPDEQQEPSLVYEMIFTKSKWLSPKKVNLILYARAGEDYGGNRILTRCPFLFNAQAVIFMLDPWSISGMRLPSSMADFHRDPLLVLENFLLFSELVRKSQAGSRLRYPLIAVTLTKSDLLRDLPSYAPYSFLTHASSNEGTTVDLDDLQAVDDEVRRLLSDYKALPKVTEAFQTRFFAVSATGHQPNSHGRYPAIEPHRCLDPLLWIFYSLGLLHAK